MTLDEFIDKVFNRYVCASDVTEKKEEYASNLLDLCGKIDFYKLLDVISKNNAKDFVPQVKEVREWAKSCYKKEFKKGVGGWIHVKIYNPILKAVINTDCFPTGTSEQTILNTYKTDHGSDGWQIIEVR